MNISTIALILLVLRLASLYFVARVMFKQWRLFRLHIDTELVQFRKIMFILSIAFVMGSIVPIAVDVYYAFINRVDDTDSPILVIYAISNAVTSLAASAVLWTIYRIALKDNNIDQD